MSVLRLGLPYAVSGAGQQVPAAAPLAARGDVRAVRSAFVPADWGSFCALFSALSALSEKRNITRLATLMINP